MSIVSDLSKVAIQSVGAHEETPKLEYAPDLSFAWVELDPGLGAVFHIKGAEGAYMDSDMAEGVDKSARLTVPLDFTELEVEYYIRRNEDDTDIWAIISGPEGTTSNAYDLQRQEPESFKMDKGQFS